MKLSAPVHLLKRQARLLARNQRIPLHEALDRIAQREGFQAWSLLARCVAAELPARTLGAELEPGDMLLLGARPGNGKTLLGLELAVEAVKSGRRGVFFSLDYGRADIDACFAAIGEDPDPLRDRFEFDDSDAINAGYIMDRLGTIDPGTVVVIDYLQLLDHKRVNPDLEEQVRALGTFARERGVIMIFLSQIDRKYDPAVRPCPDLEDVRLPNPLNLSLFSKACFLHDGEMRVSAVS